jgi:hypothetical protein
MRNIKLSGREAAVVRSIEFSVGTPGPEVLKRTSLSREDLVDIVNGLMDAGYVECMPMREHIDDACLDETLLEVNPSYALALREALKKPW